MVLCGFVFLKVRAAKIPHQTPPTFYLQMSNTSELLLINLQTNERRILIKQLTILTRPPHLADHQRTPRAPRSCTSLDRALMVEMVSFLRSGNTEMRSRHVRFFTFNTDN